MCHAHSNPINNALQNHEHTADALSDVLRGNATAVGRKRESFTTCVIHQTSHFHTLKVARQAKHEEKTCGEDCHHQVAST